MIRKEATGPQSGRRLLREAALLQRLAGCPGVGELIEVSPDGAWLILADCGGGTLGDRIPEGGLEPGWVVRFGRAVADVLAEVHRHAVVHKDINPSNLLVAPDGRPVLIDFDLAEAVDGEALPFAAADSLEGTLAYLAPEQSGRTGQPVDRRADLYALGATLYELLTGAPPFGRDTGDPLHLVHAHLAEVPAPASDVNPSVPVLLAQIVARLLEKDPGRRYQSAEGLHHDLSRLEEILAAGQPLPSPDEFGLQSRDFPLRLPAPAHPVGREPEITALVQAYRRAVAGGARGLLIRGAPGTGKSLLLEQLREPVRADGGWFVSARFDPVRRDTSGDATVQVLRALGRQLLAQPDEVLAEFRHRLPAALGGNTGIIASVPEFATLLDRPAAVPDADPAELTARTYRATIDLLRAVASPGRPVVLALDDLHWAGDVPLGLVDALLTEEDLPAVVLLAAFGDAGIDADHPLGRMLDRWQRLAVLQPPVPVGDLPPAALSAMLAEMLRLDAAAADGLAAVIGPRTGGNPWQTVELVNGLRGAGELVPDGNGWRWDAGRIHRYVGAGDVAGLLAARFDRLPAGTRRLLQALACLGGQVGLDLLARAVRSLSPEVARHLHPAAEDGLLEVLRPDGPGGGRTQVGFRSDQVRKVAYESLTAEDRLRTHHRLARALAGDPRHVGLAAGQYLQALPAVDDPVERRLVVTLFLAAAVEVRPVNLERAQEFLKEVAGLLPAAGDPSCDPLSVAVYREWHATLYALGQLEDAAALYALIDRPGADPLDVVGSAQLQMNGLSMLFRFEEALALGRSLLGRLGVEPPDERQWEAYDRQAITDLRTWMDQDEAADLERRPAADPWALARAAVINRMVVPAYFLRSPSLGWLILQARRMWAEHGPCADLIAPLGHAPFFTIAADGDYRLGYRVVRRVVCVGESRSLEPATSQARFLLALAGSPWAEPLEVTVEHARAAYEGCVRYGDPFHAAFSWNALLLALANIAPTAEAVLEECEAGIRYARRTGNLATLSAVTSKRQFARALQGRTREPGGFTDDDFDEAAHLASDLPDMGFHADRAISALIFGDEEALIRHADAAAASADQVPGGLDEVAAGLAEVMALVHRRAAATGDDRSRLLDALEAQRWRLAMFASCGWFWEDPARTETRQVLRAAARAAR
ncbi:MAG TPA: AAA family ATPase, partial [Kineosporiaceae bacterium]|nr:AAA family ATPase [Kineosporiaceae bacterium]